MRKNKEVVVLYIEDEQKPMDYWLDFIRKNWSEASCGARSLQEALEILKDDKFRPDVVIFDRGILRHKDDTVADEKAGDQLYYELCERGLDKVTAVLSGDSLEQTEPYFSMRPQLGFYSKPITADSLRKAVEEFKGRQQSER